MAITYRIDAAKRLVSCSAEGKIALAEFVAHQQRLEADAAFTFKDTANILWDFSGTTHFDHSMAKLTQLAEAWFVSGKVRRALVAKPKSEIRKFLSLWVLHRATRKDPHVQLFDSVEQARRWLEQPVS